VIVLHAPDHLQDPADLDRRLLDQENHGEHAPEALVEMPLLVRIHNLIDSREHICLDR
jgi:hypothetical protein